MKFHYIECHVIVADDPAGRSLEVARDNGWWGSRITMDSSGEEQSGDMILTTRVNEQNLAVDSIRALADELQEHGLRVTRGKTEVVTYDTKLGDTL